MRFGARLIWSIFIKLLNNRNKVCFYWFKAQFTVSNLKIYYSLSCCPENYIFKVYVTKKCGSRYWVRFLGDSETKLSSSWIMRKALCGAISREAILIICLHSHKQSARLAATSDTWCNCDYNYILLYIVKI